MTKYIVDLCDFSSTEQDQIFNKIRYTSYICVLDFYALWCRPCVKLVNQIEQEIGTYPKIAEKIDNDIITLYSDLTNQIIILKINIDIHEDIAQFYEITQIPQLYIYKNGRLENVTERNFNGLIYHLNALI